MVLLSLAGLAAVAGANPGLLGRAASTWFGVALPSAWGGAPITHTPGLPTVAVLQATDTPAPRPTSAPTATPSPTSTATASPAPTPTAVDPDSCAAYSPASPDLLTHVDRNTSLRRDYEPADLAIVPLDPGNLAYRPIPLREKVHQPLLDMLAAANQAGLRVWVMSGYRSYGDQQLAYEKWQKLYPDRAVDISALPGHSEHQLGTAIDFSAPYMVDLYGDFFNVRFGKTPEGEWLLANAAAYGFSLSYPASAVQATGYAWEPWHYRYVGPLALDLSAHNLTLTEYLQRCPSP